MKNTLLERFWSKVQRSDGCWLWTGGKTSGGYGCMGTTSNGTKMTVERAHRVSWMLHHGTILDGLCVLHHCDTPACVNPSHLYLGTQKQNADDRENRKRGNHARGERNGNAKLSFDQVREIRRLKATGLGYRRIAKQLQLAACTVYWVIAGRCWANVEAAA